MENENMYAIAKEAENVLHNTTDIETIELVMSGIEKALEDDEEYTEKMWIKLPAYNNNGRCHVSLDMTKAKPIVQGFYDRCIRIEAYEICPRILNLLNTLNQNKYEDV